VLRRGARLGRPRHISAADGDLELSHREACSDFGETSCTGHAAYDWESPIYVGTSANMTRYAANARSSLERTPLAEKYGLAKVY
jgi:hypothetical protein